MSRPVTLADTHWIVADRREKAVGESRRRAARGRGRDQRDIQRRRDRRCAKLRQRQWRGGVDAQTRGVGADTMTKLLLGLRLRLREILIPAFIAGDATKTINFTAIGRCSSAFGALP